MSEDIECLKKKFDSKMQINVGNIDIFGHYGQLDHILTIAKSGNRDAFITGLKNIIQGIFGVRKECSSSSLFIFPKTLTPSERQSIHKLSGFLIFETLTHDEKLHLFIKFPI